MARRRELDPIEIAEIQKEIALYFEQQFPERYKEHRKHIPLYEVTAALGEIYDALSEMRTNRSHDPEVQREFMRQAVGRMIIHLVDFSSRHGWNFENIVRDVWELQKGEDWDPYPDVGRPPKQESEPLDTD